MLEHFSFSNSNGLIESLDFKMFHDLSENIRYVRFFLLLIMIKYL